MQRATVLLALLLLPSRCEFANAQASPAAPYNWKNVKVGAGGFIPGIVFSRVEKDLAYLRSDMGGAYRWDHDAQRWIPMHDHLAESSYFGTESIAPDPVDPNVVYLAAGMYRNDPAAMLRSRDRGRTWEIFPVSFRMGGNEDGRGVGERLAVDPNDTKILYFGSRHDGLQRSTDRGQTWETVKSFPLKGRGLPHQDQPTNTGLSFVAFDATTGTKAGPTKTIFVGSADPGDQHLFRSDDAGETWRAVAGGPKAELLPLKAEIDDRGVLFVTYSNNAGPNGATDGAVMTFNSRTNEWTDITPDKRPQNERGPGGYCGISLDRKSPGTLAVTTLNRWGPVDTVWRSTDGGKTWADIVAKSSRDVSATPFLLWGNDKAKLGWWMAAFAIDPFDSDHACYATGATIYATREFSRVNRNEPTHWSPWVEGIEQTAVITVMSPTSGAHLVSGFGDIGGFVHHDLDVSPPQGMFTNPMFGNTTTLDFAEQQPNVIVRGGRPHDGQASLAYSDDGGKSWEPLVISPRESSQQAQRRRPRDTALIVSTDGRTFMVMTQPPQVTRDRGRTWSPVAGLPDDARPVADRVDAAAFYALDFKTRRLYISRDAGATFAASSTSGLPDDIKPDRPTWHEAAWPLHATPGKQGDLWFISRDGLFHSTDAGRTFSNVDGGVKVDVLSFGKAPQGSGHPALFAIGTRDKLKAIWRSDDAGKSWLRVNDDQHQWGTRFRCIAGDPRIFGRVYVGTDGRGIVYGEPATPATSPPSAVRADAQPARAKVDDVSDHVKVCQVGYLPNETKFAMITASPSGDVIVRRRSDGSAALTVGAAASVRDPDSGDTIHTVDFSAITQPGTYFLDVSGVGRSYDFQIAADVFARSWRLAMRSYTGQRCGSAVSLAPDFPQYHYDACHSAEATFHPSSGKQGPTRCLGGWHDAGDYGRYIVNSGITTGTLLWAYELNESKLRGAKLDIPKTDPPLPTMLAEIKWNIDWMLQMQDSADGGVWHKATSAEFCGFVMPVDDTSPVLIVGSGHAPYKTTQATADFAAVCAIAARVYRPVDSAYAGRCLDAATRAWAWAIAHPAEYFKDNPEGIKTGGYNDHDAADELLCAAAELLRTTGDAKYNDYFLAKYTRWNPTIGATSAQGWPDLHNFAMYAYALCGNGKTDRTAAEKIRADAIAAADAIVERSRTNGYRIPLRSNEYYWGSNGVVANYAMMLSIAHRFAPKQQYRDTAQDTLHYLLGRNTFNTSFVTHVGSKWPMHPHHRPSAADGVEQPWPGLLVGGPNAGKNSPPARQWADDEKNYTTNETAINWNAPLVFLLTEALPAPPQ